jgi:hypothetical protein
MLKKKLSGEFKRGVSPSFINKFPFPLLRGRGHRG